MAHDFKRFPELTNTQLESMPFDSPHPQITEDFDGEVVNVHDGDTVTVRGAGRDFDFPIRFLDIDAPELSEGGEEARDWLKNQIEGKMVLVQIDPKNRVDKYGRLLGSIVAGGLNMSETMLTLGLAVPFGQRSDFTARNSGQSFESYLARGGAA